MRWPQRALVSTAAPTELLGRVVRYLAPSRRLGALLVVLVVAESLLTLIPALLVGDFVDSVNRTTVDFGHLAELVAAGLGATITAGLIAVAESYVGVRIAQAAIVALRQDVFEHLVGQSIAFHTRSRAGELTSRLFNDVGGIDSLLTTGLAGLARSVLTASGALLVMCLLDWKLSLITLAVFPGIALAFRLASRFLFRARDAVQRQLGELTAFAQENLGLSAIMLVRSFGREPLIHERFSALNHRVRDREIKLTTTTSWLVFASSLLLLAGPAVVVLVGGYLVSRHELSLGTLLAFGALAAGRFGPAMHGLASGAASAVGSTALWARVFEVLDTESEITERPDAHRLSRSRGAVELEHVSFTYPGQGRPALADVSLTVPAGQLVALVGPSGAGKTTLTSLLTRFVDPQAGRVCIDGHDVRELTLASLSEAIGVVFQDNFLFHASLGENLRLGRPEASDAQLAQAARDAFLADLIAEFPDGYDTVVGERGHRLSGGEKQRVAIARVMLKDPPILILDEATSHLDSASEHTVQLALSRLFRGRTSLVIAHRLSTVLAADLIVVLDKGRIVERGTHAELLDRSGLYARLYELQFRSRAPASGPTAT